MGSASLDSWRVTRRSAAPSPSGGAVRGGFGGQPVAAIRGGTAGPTNPGSDRPLRIRGRHTQKLLTHAELDRSYAGCGVVVGDPNELLPPGVRLPNTGPVHPFGGRAVRCIDRHTGRTTRFWCSVDLKPRSRRSSIPRGSSTQRSRDLLWSMPCWGSASSRPPQISARWIQWWPSNSGSHRLTVLAIRPDRYVGLRSDDGDPAICRDVSAAAGGMSFQPSNGGAFVWETAVPRPFLCSAGGGHLVPKPTVQVDVVARGLAGSGVSDVGVERVAVVGHLGPPRPSERRMVPTRPVTPAPADGFAGHRQPVDRAGAVAGRLARRIGCKPVQECSHERLVSTETPWILVTSRRASEDPLLVEVGPIAASERPSRTKTSHGEHGLFTIDRAL